MTENFPGDGRPMDAEPPAEKSGPAEPRAEQPTEQPAVQQPASQQPADPQHDTEQPTVHRSEGQPPADQQPEWQRPQQNTPSTGFPAGTHGGPTHSGAIPVAQVPQSPWAGGGYGQQNPGQGFGQQGAGAGQGSGQPNTGQQAFGQQSLGHQSGYHQPVAPPQGGYGYPSMGGPPTGPITTSYQIGGLPPEPPRRRGSGGLIAGIAVLALVIGGAAGGLGGYLVSHNNGSVVSSLDQSVPANQTANAPAGSVQAVAGKVLPVVVTIAAEFQDQSGLNGDTGSGFIISSDGDILTNNHVIADAANGGRIQVIFANGKSVNATVVGRDPTTDIAVIKAQGVTGLPIAQLGRSDALSVGQNVVAIGAPFELSGTVTSGIVSSLHRPTEAGDGGAASQTDGAGRHPDRRADQPGQLGRPAGEHAGPGHRHQLGDLLAELRWWPQGQTQGGNVGIGFAIPINQAKRTADEIVKTGKAIQTVLGVQVSGQHADPGRPAEHPAQRRVDQVGHGGWPGGQGWPEGRGRRGQGGRQGGDQLRRPGGRSARRRTRRQDAVDAEQRQHGDRDPERAAGHTEIGLFGASGGLVRR